MGITGKKILLVSTGDVNGAYEAIYKLGHLFIGEGHTVCMLVKSKTKKENFIIQYSQVKKKYSIVVRMLFRIKNKLKKILGPIPQPIYFDPKYYFLSKDETKENIVVEQVLSQIGFVPDLIITGMTDGFLNSTDLLNLHKETQAKIYNITVDMNYFTGGCHYAWDCKGYIKGCDEKCPAIMGGSSNDLAKINFETKLKNVQAGKFQIITGSGWTLKQAKESKIYKDQNVFYNINSLIDTKLFNASNRHIAKSVFNFDSSKFYIMAGSQNANDSRKGFSYFVDALKVLESQLTIEEKKRIVIIVVSHEVPKEFELLKFEKQKINFITDYRLLILLYQAIDLFVNSSIEDSGPMMVSEALACGTPVVGFDMGVVNNMVINNFNGYKAVLKDSTDLAQGIEEILKLSKENHKQYSINAVNQVEEYSSFQYASKVFNQIFAQT